MSVGGKHLSLKLGGDLSMASTLSHMGLSSFGSDADMFDDDVGPVSVNNSPGGGSIASGAAGASRPTRKRRKTVKGEGCVSASDKSEVTRLRNREHARSTRRRKKMYVECLKQQVAELLVKQQQIESGVLDGTDAVGDPQSEEITIRKTIIVTFLQYRTTGVTDTVRWADLVDQSFAMLQPRTPFRPLPPGGESVGNNRRSTGVDAAIQDSKSIASMLNMIRNRVKAQKPDTPRKKLNAVSLSFDVDASDILVVGDKLMCHWNAGTTGLVKCGFGRECTIDGMLKCSFNDKHKLVDMELTYDVMAMTRQLQNYGLIDLSVLNFRGACSATTSLGLKHPIAAGGGSGKKSHSIASKLPLPSLAAMPPFRVPLMKSGSGGLLAPMGGGLAAKPGNSGDSSKDSLPGGSGGNDLMSQMMMMNMLSMGGIGMPSMMPTLINPASLMGGMGAFNLLSGAKNSSLPRSVSSSSLSSSAEKIEGGPAAVARESVAAKVPTSPAKSSEAAVAAANAAAAAAAAVSKAAVAVRPEASKDLTQPLAMSNEQMHQMQKMMQMSMPANALMGPMLTPAMFPIMSPAMFAAASIDANKKTNS